NNVRRREAVAERTATVEIQPQKLLIELAAKGELVLFLGAGAIVGSLIGKDNRKPLLAKDRLGVTQWSAAL
ncbi:MAG: hypothetical protein WBM28_13115, partial [Burkholderiales bacterium]